MCIGSRRAPFDVGPLTEPIPLTHLSSARPTPRRQRPIYARSMDVSPTLTSSATAIITAAALGTWSLEPARTEFVKSWSRARFVTQRILEVGIHILAGLLVIAAAQGLGLKPAATDPGWKLVLFGVSWAVTATALLRAELTGLASDGTGPGGSLLRGALRRVDETTARRTRASVRTVLDAIDDVSVLRANALGCRDDPTRPHQTDMDSQAVRDAKTLALNIHAAKAVSTQSAERDEGLTDLRKMLEDLIVANHVLKPAVRTR